MSKNEVFSLWGQGHFKKNCLLRELHLLILILKNPEAKEEKLKIQQKKNESTIDKMKEISFRDENGKHILVHKGQDL